MMKIIIRSRKRLLASIIRRIRHRRRVSDDPRSISPAAIEFFVRTQYGLRAITKPELMVTGLASAVWRFEGREETWYAKIYQRRSNSEARIAEEAALCARMNQHGVRTPLFVTASTGRPVASLRKGRETYNVTVMRSQQGREVNAATLTPNELSEIARAIGRMHRLLAGYRPENGNDVYSSRMTLPKPSFPGLLRSPNRNLFTPHELQRCEAVENGMLNYLERNLRSEGLTQSVLHGDLKLEHVRLCPDGGVYLFDFAEWHQGLVAWDLAILIQNLYVSKDAAAENISFERFEASKDIFLSSYAREHSLTVSDREALTALMMVRIIDACRSYCWISRIRGRVFPGHRLRRYFELAEYLFSRPEARIPTVVSDLSQSCTAPLPPLLPRVGAH